jgi:hypothetical protein
MGSGLRYAHLVVVVWFAALWSLSFFHFVPVDFSKPLTWLMTSLILVGGIGALLPVLSGLGPLRPPNSWEWPAGYARNVLTTPEGKHIVPLWPAGRIQIYDSQWRFLCGWNVDAWGVPFEVDYSSAGEVEVLRILDRWIDSYTMDGRYIVSRRSEEPGPDLPKGKSVVVPTRLWLWIFSSPIMASAVAVVGFAGLVVLSGILG